MYSMLAFAGVLYLYGVMRLEGEHEKSILTTFLVAIATALALYSHNLAFLTLVAATAYLAWRRLLAQSLRLLVAQVLGMLLFLRG